MDELNNDRRLLEFNTYEDYLDSLVTAEDLHYLGSPVIARTIAELGYRSSNDTLNRQQFEHKKAAVMEKVNPSRKAHILESDGLTIYDPFLKQLATRERSNRVGIMTTIINLRHHTKSGFEISGYIDFEQSLRWTRERVEGAVDWHGVFSGKKRLWPQPTDLGYYNWRTGVSVVNTTRNYKPIMHPKYGLVFRNRHDRNDIIADPLVESPGTNTVREDTLSSRTILTRWKARHKTVIYQNATGANIKIKL